MLKKQKEKKYLMYCESFNEKYYVKVCKGKFIQLRKVNIIESLRLCAHVSGDQVKEKAEKTLMNFFR